MRRFHAPDLPPSGDVWLAGEEGRHLARVLRAREGDEVGLFDGRGREARCVVVEVARDRVRLRIEADVAARTAARELTLCCAVPKGRRMDWLVEKTVECGVGRILPVAFARAERAQVGATNLRRWRRAAVEAAKQCDRADVPSVEAPALLEDVLARVAGVQLLVADPEAGACVPPAGPAAVFVGPEGGVDPAERRVLDAAGAAAIGLGGLVLRVETAAVVACHRLIW